MSVKRWRDVADADEDHELFVKKLRKILDTSEQLDDHKHELIERIDELIRGDLSNRVIS